MVDLEKAIIESTKEMIDDSISARHDIYSGKLILLLMDLHRIQDDYFKGLCDKATYCIECEKLIRNFAIWQELEYPKIW